MNSVRRFASDEGRKIQFGKRRKTVSIRETDLRYSLYVESILLKLQRIGSFNYPTAAARANLGGSLGVVMTALALVVIAVLALVIDRRSFLTAAGAATGLTLAAGALPSSRAFGANERFRVGVIGTGGQGQSHVKAWGSHDDVDLVYVCDVDSDRF